MLGLPAEMPETFASHARRGLPPQVRTTRRGAALSSVRSSLLFAVSVAASAVTVGVVATPWVVAPVADAVSRTRPLASVITTASPPTTGRPL